VTRTISFATPSGPGRKHRAEDTHHEIERVVPKLGQCRRVALPERQVREALRLSAPVSRLDKIARDIDPDHASAESRSGERRRPITASEVEHRQGRPYSERLDESRAAASHGRRDAREIALVSKCLIGVRHKNKISAHTGLRAR
jgi:hypothetical protein